MRLASKPALTLLARSPRQCAGSLAGKSIDSFGGIFARIFTILHGSVHFYEGLPIFVQTRLHTCRSFRVFVLVCVGTKFA